MLVWALTVGLNVVPAFMPPTWALLAYFRVTYGLDVWLLALVGAMGATTGRTLLALLSRAVGMSIIPARWRANVSALVETIRSRPAFSLPTLGMFALGPVPSNHLFIAAGIAKAPLAPILAVFGSARFVSYLIWVTTATTAAASLRDVFGPQLRGGLGIAVQIAGFVILILLMQVDWAARLQRWSGTRDTAAARGEGDVPLCRHGDCESGAAAGAAECADRPRCSASLD
jgi:hypothetical protein